mgnify:CR=1 FL=1
MKYPFKSLLLAATVLAAASCAKDDTQSGGEETAGPVIVNASPAAIGGEIILKLKTEASGIVEKSRAQGVSKGSGIDEIDRILNTVNTVRFERLFPDGGRFEERTRREGLHLWYYAKYDPSVPTSEMASLLSSCKDIEIIEYSLAAETSDHRRAASPAADANAISVGATAFTGAPAYYTNYGTWVQISAPGGDQMLSNAYGGVYSTSVAADGSSGYEGSQGTSMACPHVSGACALAVSYYYGAEKRMGLTGEMLRQALLSSTQSVDRYCTGKYQQYLGNMGIGSLDTYKLLRNIAKIDGIRCNRPNGAFYVFADISSFGLSSVEFCNRLLDEQKVVCIPGSAFGECGEGFIRIAYTCSDDNLYEALNRISCFCKKLMK